MHTAVINGHSREWLVHLPTHYHAGQAVPLVLAFHGHSGTPAGMARMTGLDRIADSLEFMVVYRAGVDRSWAAGVDSQADKARVNDVAFTRALLDRLEKHYSIDPQHVVLSGFSNGAHMVQLLGCKLADRVASCR